MNPRKTRAVAFAVMAVIALSGVILSTSPAAAEELPFKGRIEASRRPSTETSRTEPTFSTQILKFSGRERVLLPEAKSPFRRFGERGFLI
jgi:hypothetical protein